MKEFQSIVRALRWIISQQNHDGGWPWTNGHSSNPAPTGHILYILSELGCAQTRCALGALSWLEKYCRLNKGTDEFFGWDSRDPMWQHPNNEGTILGSVSLLALTSEGIYSKITKENLKKMISRVAEKLVSSPDDTIAERGWWTFQMICFGLRLAEYKGDLWKELAEIALKRQCSDGTWEHEGRECNNQTAAVLLGLLQNPKINPSQLKSILGTLLAKAQVHDDKAFWKYEPQEQAGPRRGPVLVTRWVIWALEEGRERGLIVKGQTTVIEKGIKWLIEQQQAQGYWVESEDLVPASSFSAYALFVIARNLFFKFKQEKKDLRLVLSKEVKAVDKRIEYCVRIGGSCPHKVISSNREIFVLMPFRESFDCVWKSLKSVEQEMGIPIKRADDSKTQQEIICDVCKGIQSASLIIADISMIPYDKNNTVNGQGRDNKTTLAINRNVLYELGIAHALEKPVILISQTDPDVFDFRNIRTIKYNLSDLDGLQRQIQVTLEKTSPQLLDNWRTLSR